MNMRFKKKKKSGRINISATLLDVTPLTLKDLTLPRSHPCKIQ